MISYAVLCFGVLATVCGQLTNEETNVLRKVFTFAGLECMEEMGVSMEFSMEDLENIEENKSNVIVKHNPVFDDYCYAACAMRKLGLLNAEGYFVKEASLDFMQKFTKNSEALEKAKEMIEDCASVNEKKVSDGKKGCKRAELIRKCYRKHESKFGKV